MSDKFFITLDPEWQKKFSDSMKDTKDETPFFVAVVAAFVAAFGIVRAFN